MMNWLWTDMDAYFASAEQWLRSELRGRPVGIIPLETEHTCVIAASYDAKRCGVKVGTAVRAARRLCPRIVLVKARPSEYVRLHHEILEVVDRYAPIQRVYSIDEWTIQLQGSNRQPEEAIRLAIQIQQHLQTKYESCMTCSIGIAPTRLLAKIACSLQKPAGLTLLPVNELPGRLAHLPLEKLHGISTGMLARLEKHRIRTVPELWDISRSQAIRIWGSVSGGYWWAGLHGYDEPELPTRRRSMSHGNVLSPQFRTEAGVHVMLIRLLCKLAHRMRRDGYAATRLHISLQDTGGRGFAYDASLPAVQDTPTLLQQFCKLWATRLPSAHPIKKVNVCLGGLIRATEVARPLLDEFAKLERISQTMDQINEQCGSMAVYFAPLHNCRQEMENKIAFGRIPDNLKG